MRYAPLEYRVSRGKPDSVVPVKNDKVYKVFGIISSLVVTGFIIYAYWEAFFGEVTEFEFLFVLGTNSIFAIMNLMQWFSVLPASRNEAVLIMNNFLEMQHAMVQEPRKEYELTCLTLLTSSLFFPVFYFPIFHYTPGQLPGMFRSLHLGIGNLVQLCRFPEPTASTYIIRRIVFAVIATAFGHAVVNLSIVLSWILASFFNAIGHLEAGLEFTSKT